MIIEVSSAKSGFKFYLENGKKQGQDFHRDEIDQRIPLAGNLEVWAIACEDENAKGNRYDHFTISFSEDYISDEMLQKTIDEFRDHLFAAWPEEDRHRIAFYAEAHRPKIKTYINAANGYLIERKTHIHIGVGRHDLLTGKHMQLTGYLDEKFTENLKYIDAFQESFNARHGFASPKTSPRINAETAVDILARYTGNKPKELATFNDKKTALEIKIQKAVIDQCVTSWDGFEKLLKEFGTVSKLREGKSSESFAIMPEGEKRRIRLNGIFFQKDFIGLSTAEKIATISDRARRAYTEQMDPRMDPVYLAETLDYWRRVKSREIRYLHTNSDYYKNTYLPADPQQQEKLLNDLERKDRGIESSPDDSQRKIATPGAGLRKLPVRDLDGIQKRSEMLLRRDHDLDVRADVADWPVGSGLRQTDAGADTGGAKELKQPSSVLARVQEDLRERYERAQAREKFAQISHNIDGAQLLARLSHSHGLNIQIYGVENAADGSTRIRCGSRALSANDFLSKELGLPWREAAPILREVYELQIGKRVIRPRGQPDGVESRRLWKAFQTSREDQIVIAERLADFDAQTKVGRAELLERLRRERALALAAAGQQHRKAVLASESLKAAILKAEYSESRRELRSRIRPPQKDAWREFLQERAQAGNEAALRTLRGLDDRARDTQVLTISGVGRQVQWWAIEDGRKRLAKNQSDLLKSLTMQVETNGDVTYSSDGHAVLLYQGQSIQVLDPNSDEAIVAGLMLAQQMFGRILSLTGPEEFQARVVALAVEHGMPIQVADSRLEQLRLQLHTEKTKPAQPERAPRPSPQGGQGVVGGKAPIEPTAVPAAQPDLAPGVTAALEDTVPVAPQQPQQPQHVQQPADPLPEPAVDYLADIHQKIDVAKAAAAPGSSWANSTATEADHEKWASGVVLVANQEFVVVRDRHKVNIYKVSELVKNLAYDGIDTVSGCFAAGNELTRKHGADGMRTLIVEKREHMKSLENRKDNKGVGR